MRAIVALSTFAMIFIGACGESEWWKTMSLYQVYPRSFMDANNDGIGDLKGIESKLQHLVDSKIDAFWISPIYPSPMVDFGYDISDFKNIDPFFGTMQDFDSLLKEAHNLGLKLIMDFVPNHSSDQHEWFKKSVKKIDPYTNYYIWHPGKIVNGTRQPPNNWVAQFYEYAWKWNDERQEYYFHQFASAQPDLNYRNPYLVEEMKNVLRFWLDKGVDGFRVDAIPFLFEVEDLRDEPLSGQTNNPINNNYTLHIYTQNLDETYDMVRQWRKVLDEYESRVLMMEAYTNISKTMEYYDAGATFPFNFGFIEALKNGSTTQECKEVIDTWMSSMPKGSIANWVAGNHDQPRLASRFGRDFAPAVTIMVQLLPGVAVTYNGEEIGMENTFLTWEETKDPQGCNAGPSAYASVSRDPQRTPFQWDDSTNAGFSNNTRPWLPVNQNYITLNLKAQKEAENSVYKSFLKVTSLRDWPAVKSGSLQTELLNNNVFAFSRELDNERSVYVITNLANETQTVNLKPFARAPSEVELYHTTSDAGIPIGEKVKSEALRIPAQGAAIFVSAVLPDHH